MYKRICYIVLLCHTVCCLQAQLPEPFLSAGKWGYRMNGKELIAPQYDTAFAFDQTASVAMVAIRNDQRTEINLLTGEEKSVLDYYFINKHNIRYKLSPNPTDSIYAFPAQQELSLNYLSGAPVFKLLYGQKVWLFNKQGKQLSAGYDDMYPAGVDGRFYITETYSEWDKEIVRIKGLIDTSGRVVVNCEKKQIRINTEDSIVYACSGIFNRRLADEVFDYKGNIIYSNKNHIEFAAKNLYVYRLYEPKEIFVVANSTKDMFGIEGLYFYDLKRNKALITDKNTWLLVNLQTGKKQKVNKEAFMALTVELMQLCL